MNKPEPDQTQAKAYVREEIRYPGVRGQPQALRCRIKQVYGLSQCLARETFPNLVEATITPKGRLS